MAGSGELEQKRSEECDVDGDGEVESDEAQAACDSCAWTNHSAEPPLHARAAQPTSKENTRDIYIILIFFAPQLRDHPGMVRPSSPPPSPPLLFSHPPPAKEWASKIFGPTFQLFNRSPGALPRRSFTNLRAAASPPNVPKTRYSLDSKTRTVSSDYEVLKMAFGQPGPGFGGQGAKVQLGPELQEIQTQEVGFLSIAGDSKIRLFPTPWPSDSLPPPTSSLLSVSSAKGLLAAAGPEGLVIASTDAVRKAYTAEATSDSNIRPFQPQLQIPLPQKASHVAFSGDDNVLVVAAADGSGLIAYEVAALLQGNSQPALTLSLNGARLRALLPNPETHELFAAVTADGELLVVNLKNNEIVRGPSGPILKTGVSCVSWSNKGKQLVAGLVDGSIFQMTPVGQGKAEIPRPPDLEAGRHVSSISWLENHVFFVVYTPTSIAQDQPPPSYYIITRQPPDSYTFQKLPEGFPPFGLERNPAYQFIGRLRDFKPDLKDALIVASTSSSDITLFTKSSKTLSEEGTTAGTIDAFTATTMSEDSRRADLPLTDDSENTSPIGLAIDLSSKDIIPSPIPGEDIKDSGSPLPGILVLNNDGVLSSWWFVYSESIRQGIPFHGLVATGGTQPPQAQQATPTASMPSPQTPKAAFGQSTFGQSGFGGSTTPAFGKPSTPAFGAPSALGTASQTSFGTPSTLGSQPTWGSQGFGGSQSPSQTAATSSFGSTTPMGSQAAPAFGSPSMPGQRTVGFGQPSPLGKQAATPTFGQTGGLGFAGLGAPTGSTGTASPFTAKPATGGFGAFATGGGFAAAGPAKPSTESPFSQATGDNPFAKAGQGFGSLGDKVPSAAPSQQSGFSGFTLTSSFKPDTSTDMDEDKPDDSKGAFSFGGLMDAGKVTSPPPAPAPTVPSIPPKPQTPVTQKAVEKEGPRINPFGQPLPSEPVPALAAPIQAPLPLFGKPPIPSEPKLADKPSIPPPSLPSESSLSESTVKVEPPSDKESAPMPKLVEPPLPPEPTSRAAYAPGDTSASSSSISKGSYEEAPLPPDFIAPKKTGTPKEVAVALPEESEGESADFEDSGEDIENEISPVDETTDHRILSLKTSPESSFGGPAQRSPDSAVFKAPSPVQPQKGPKQLFGEISQPMFPPPNLQNGRLRATPRSPSPIRRTLAGSTLARESLRSTSAPSAPGRAIAQRKVTLESSMLMNRMKPPPDEEEQPEEANRERLAAESQELSEDDEDEQIRADLARPLSPAPTLDPFYPHQDYTGESLKPGIPGQIERLYRDINAMIDTLGINSRSLSSFLLYQETEKEPNCKQWLRILQSESPNDILEEKLLLTEVDKLVEGVRVLDNALQEQQVQTIEEKLEKCHQLFSKDLVTLRGQCASLRRTIDAHTDTLAIASAPLSAEQATLQQDLRKASTAVQSKMANLEKEISLLRARIADSTKPESGMNGSTRRKAMARPTVEAVTSTITTMTSMAEKKSGDIDVLEAQLRRLGIDVSSSVQSRSREASPYLTPPPKRPSRLPTTPGSRGSVDGGIRSSYHTPESSSHLRFRSSLLGSTGKSLLQNVSGPSDLVLAEDSQRWKTKTARRREVVGHVRTALLDRKVKVRGMDEI
ncbi:hypothetical protein FQN55_006759 [Onygenales sp. PD_40]|nr:hypothetical protein FQN55_006759 [Onygenales sp. PD_40]